MKIYITPEAKQKLDLYVDAVDDEISGLGKVRRVGRKILIEDIYLLKQEASSSSTDLNMSAVADFMLDMMNKKEKVEDLKLWWHSHGSMGAFWSGTDEKTIEGFENEWMISLVVNRKEEYKCRLDVYDPVHLVVENAELCLAIPEPTAAFRDAIKKEVDTKVKTKKYYAGGKGMCGFHGDIEDTEDAFGRRGGYIEERDRRWGPVPSATHTGKCGVWKKDSSGQWRMVQHNDDDDKEEVSKGETPKQEGEVQEEKGRSWQGIGFRQSEK